MQEDIYNRKNDYKAELKRLKKSAISQKNKEIIEEFHKQLFSEGVSDGRVIKLSTQLREIGRLLGKDFDAAEEANIREVVAAINITSRSEETNKTFRLLQEIMKDPKLLKEFEEFKQKLT